MTASVDLLTDAFARVRESVHDVLRGLSDGDVDVRVDDDANSIGWLVWHLTRIQDDHLADVAGTDQVWQTGGWHQAFGLSYPVDATGYGHRSAEVGAFQGITARQLADYYDAVHQHTLTYLADIRDADLDRVVDTRWNPPVTLGVRLISVIADDLQHVGQAALIRGILRRRS
ncbi:DUF664 domain-containing protein [Streptacidiphilus sp. EB129]|uniref:mycothiol transferase n=1 Tax=Streptacidiphilus sp. EB129 TaxID=3156262 RepID=UPI003519ACF5